MPAVHTIETRLAELEDIDRLVPLFEAYRNTWGGVPNPPASRDFLFFRLLGDEAVLIYALFQGEPVGFLQLYPSFSATALTTLWVGADFYVVPQHRNGGIEARLLGEAEALVHARNDDGIVYSVPVGNAGETEYLARTFSQAGYGHVPGEAQYRYIPAQAV